MVAQNYFVMAGQLPDEKRLFQRPFPPALWDRIQAFIASLKNLPLWVNRDLSNTIFGAKQNRDFWQQIFSTGLSPQGEQVLTSGLNVMEMIKEPLEV